MKKNILFAVALWSILVAASFPFAVSAQDFTVVFYNTENLYDTIDDKKVSDSQYLPDARIPWNTARYNDKLQKIAQVFSEIDPHGLPSLIGVCEVENKKVLEDLVAQPALKNGDYRIVHYNSPDQRGIDVALLYSASDFTVVKSISIRVDLPTDTLGPTRDILYVKGFVNNSSRDTLHIFVNHWPSRREGQEASEPNRMAAAKALRQAVDSLLALKAPANILIMGDFNDEPTNKSLTEGLNAGFPGSVARDNKLYNLMEKAYTEGRGTLYFDKWQVFDQFIISKNLMEKQKGLNLPEKEGKIFSADYLLYTPKTGDPRPNRTIGNQYFGGYSDHLPVYLEFKVK
jgi:predicted extracellular nuclease